MEMVIDAEVLSIRRKAFELFEKEKYNDAIKQFALLLKHSPDDALLLCNRAASYFRLELYKHCIKDCDEVIRLNPTLQRAYLVKGLALSKLSKQVEAEKIWASGADIWGDVELQFELKKRSKTQWKESASPSPSSSSLSLSPSSPSSASLSSPALSMPNSEKALAIASSIPIDPLQASQVVAAKGLVQHGLGQANIDEKIAMGYLQVNTGNYQQGILIFDSLLKSNPKTIAAYLGRGTAFALGGDLDQAICDFSAAIRVDHHCIDAWKRRGQARAAKGCQDLEALSDLSEALKLGADSDIYHQRGLVYFKMKNYERALMDFLKSNDLEGKDKLNLNHVGLCFNAIGSPAKAIEYYQKAIDVDPQFKEGFINLGQAYKDSGNYEQAESFYTKALALDEYHTTTYNLRGISRFGAGFHSRALQDLKKALHIDSNHKDCRHMAAVVQHGLGLLRGAVSDYTVCVNAKPDHVSWYQREVALFTHHHLDIPWTDFNLDRDIDPYFKEGWCKRLPPAILNYVPQSGISSSIPDVTQSDKPNDESMSLIIETVNKWGKLIQYDSGGYLHNRRQHRMAGLATLEIAQTLQEFFRTGKPFPSRRVSSEKTPKNFTFSWRDMYDIAIRWRQYSEPNDPVWWVDLLSPEQFAEGFGSHTPIVTGQTRVVRYFPMFDRSFMIVKSLIVAQAQLSASVKKQVAAAKTLKDLHEIMNRDFWICTPCYSRSRPGHIMEGTRLTLQGVPPEGYEYSIRTPGTPTRTADYIAEFDNLWESFLEEVLKPERDLDKISDIILSISFYWYNFMPLSRGGAAVGYVGLLGMFLSLNIEIDVPIAKGVQPDWEGILGPRHTDFISALSRWMYPARKEISIKHLPSVAKTFPTIRRMIEALNVAV